MKVHLRMLGCRLNQSEIDTMARQLVQQGHEIVDDPTTAERVIVNTCAVTNEATRDSRKLIRELNRANPEAEITVTGCYAQISPQDISVLPGVAHVVDNRQKERIVEQITGTPTALFDIEPHARDSVVPGALGRTRAFVKVQDGCDNACTFCITTVARGEGRSRAIHEIVSEVQALHAMGYQEAVLTGVHLGSYGHDFGDKQGLKRLVTTLLAETDIPRLRLSSLEPWDIAEGFFELWQNPRLCPHLHLPLQSGCDATLKRMRRNTTQAEFRRLVTLAREHIPDLSITTDVIVGFPGETDEEFTISEAFIHEMNFAKLHVFRYSVREGTPAARMKGQLPKRVKKARSQRLLQHSSQQEERFARRFIGQKLHVLWEQVIGATEDGFISVGYTENYIRARAIHPRPLTNLITPVQALDYVDGQLIVNPVIE
ncbi:MAG: tRNA (N(6)-L-threonylcarbamoyladenosine(37)-C(2))-methylthiotransferase MtaB [Chloroflexi bacterium]|nr:MAG: tRNA (N(6)-L-threonylcarbamoyladenosine(37)-C(2))-methylthiotransferase MtaB [Chloroflexota bacterium]